METLDKDTESFPVTSNSGKSVYAFKGVVNSMWILPATKSVVTSDNGTASDALILVERAMISDSP